MVVVGRMAVVTCAVMVVMGCTAGGGRPETGVRDGGTGSDDLVSGCDATQDADGDGIADAAEGMSDSDGDGIPNHLDTDSDDDGTSDAEEHRGAVPCSRPDVDDDGLANWVDPDSDNDGLSDREEREVYLTDAYAIDTDGDGVSDLGEARGTMTDPRDASATISEGDFFVVLPYQGDRVQRKLLFGTNIKIADVYFLIDTTGSMEAPITNVTSSLTRIAAEIGARIDNVQMGVGRFEDFPNGRVLDIEAYGGPGDVPYENVQDITADLSSVQTALGSLGPGGGGDGPESHVEALYQTATGVGGTWTFGGGAAPFAMAARDCPSIPDETGVRRGYPCFRPNSLPIVVMVSDVGWHNGPRFENRYRDITPEPHRFDDAAVALDGIGARFIGVAVNGQGRMEAEEMARMTGTVDGSGMPLVYNASGGTVSDAILEGIETIAGSVAQNVTTRTEDVPGNPSGVNATAFIKAIVPVEGYVEGIPMMGYTEKDDRWFYGVVPGTQVEFDVDFWNDFHAPVGTAEIFKARIIVVGNGVSDLDSRNVYIIVPPAGGTILI